MSGPAEGGMIHRANGVEARRRWLARRCGVGAHPLDDRWARTVFAFGVADSSIPATHRPQLPIFPVPVSLMAPEESDAVMHRRRTARLLCGGSRSSRRS